MRVSRVLIGPFARERGGWRSPHLALAAAAFLITSPAPAAHCPRGQIWMVHARECVGRHVTQKVTLLRQKVTHLREKVTHLVPEEPSHHGLTFVHVIEPPPDPPKPPPPEIHIPYELPPSRWNHLDVVDFERIGK